MLEYIRNFIFGSTIKELRSKIGHLESDAKNKVRVYCENKNCFEYNSDGTCGLYPFVFIDRNGNCKEYMNDCSLDKELKEETSNGTIFIVNEER